MTTRNKPKARKKPAPKDPTNPGQIARLERPIPYRLAEGGAK